MAAQRNLRTAVLTLICVVGLFLFPAAIGSFAATHGPVTAMRASSQAQETKRSISSAKCRAVTVVAHTSLLHASLPKETCKPEASTDPAAATHAPGARRSDSLRV